ncbi:MAG: glutaredoxin family protein [Opitutales bacterium]|nr:glutaredoxin family protein [Opitutales bacterium]MCH8539476.1 glutaredoxin family protein [Opitutales bacterium]
MTSPSAKPILYIKSGCPWCREAENFLHSKGVSYEVKDVLIDPAAARRMQQLTGQTLTPSFEYRDFVVADFSVEEFVSALRKNPKVAQELNLA